MVQAHGVQRKRVAENFKLQTSKSQEKIQASNFKLQVARTTTRGTRRRPASAVIKLPLEARSLEFEVFLKSLKFDVSALSRRRLCLKMAVCPKTPNLAQKLNGC